MPLREEIITVSFAVVASSIFLQGLTIPPMLRKIAAEQRSSRASALWNTNRGVHLCYIGGSC
jgi:NhaP-type Na+/H+ or K+/H+ antiporter